MKRLLPILGCGLLLVGCNVVKDYERPEAFEKIQPLYRDTTSLDQLISAEADTINFGAVPWREVFTEPQLQTLIDQAIANNLDLKKSEITIRQAEEGLRIARLEWLPTVAFAPQGGISSFDFGKASKTYTLPLAVNWDLGSWGSIRGNRRLSETNLLLTKAAHQATQSAIICGVANLYYTLQMLDAQLATTRSTIALWKRNVEVMEAMREGGMTNDAAVTQSKANLVELQASEPKLLGSIREVENSLCLLLGQPSHNIERGAFNPEGFPASLKTGVPVQLLAQRPDVRIAELTMTSKFYGINIARSKFYPSLNITGTAGWTNSAGMIVINPAKFFAQAAASLTQPLFAQGKLKANLRVSQMDYEAAQLDFQNTILKAGQEVSNALNSYHVAEQQQAHREQEVQLLTDALEKTQFLFLHTNTTTYLSVLTAQQSLLSAQLSLINDKYAKVQAAINLYQALGGASF